MVYLWELDWKNGLSVRARGKIQWFIWGNLMGKFKGLSEGNRHDYSMFIFGSRWESSRVYLREINKITQCLSLGTRWESSRVYLRETDMITHSLFFGTRWENSMIYSTVYEGNIWGNSMVYLREKMTNSMVYVKEPNGKMLRIF